MALFTEDSLFSFWIAYLVILLLVLIFIAVTIYRLYAFCAYEGMLPATKVIRNIPFTY